MKKTFSIIAAGLLLAGCANQGAISTVNDVVDLATHLECAGFTVDDEKRTGGWCEIDNYRHRMFISSDPNDSAHLYLKDSAETAVGVGDNWVFVCGRVEDEQCLERVEVAGGQLYLK